MKYLLNIAYALLLLLLSPWIVFAAVRKGKYREGHAAKLLGLVPPRTSSRPCVWMHAVSVGEVNQLAPLVTRVEQRWPDVQCVISTTTRAGFALATTRYPDHSVFYCPLDFSWAVRSAVRRIRPDLLVLVELELWPNLIQMVQASGARVAIVNARLGDRSFRGYARIRPFVSRVLRRVDLIAAQDRRIADRFVALGADAARVHVTGSIKYDGAETQRDNADTRRLGSWAGFAPDDVVFLAGSTGDPEERLALETFRRLLPHHPQLRLVLVPRHPERFEAVARMLAETDIPWVRRTAHERPAGRRSGRVILVDKVGELRAWWGTAQIAFVGGSLTQRGGQNMIEPAAYGAAVCFGPNTWNFRDIVATLLAEQAAVVVRDGREMEAFVARCLADAPYAATLGRRAQAVVRRQFGAADRTAELLLDVARPSGTASRKPRKDRTRLCDSSVS